MQLCMMYGSSHVPLQYMYSINTVNYVILANVLLVLHNFIHDIHTYMYVYNNIWVYGYMYPYI